MPKPTKRADVTPPKRTALQWSDMPQASQQDVSGQMRNLGMARSGVGEQQQRLEAVAAKETNAPKTRQKAGDRLASLAAIGPHLTDNPITHTKATNARVRLVDQGVARSQAEGTNAKHDWYFQHNKKLGDVARDTGYERDTMITASAVMSPQNNPEQELSAVTALAHAHHPEASVHVTPQAVAAAAALKNPVDLSEYAGKSLHPTSLSAEHFATLSETAVRGHVQASEHVNLNEIAKGGVKDNVAQAIHVLRGSIGAEHAIDPRTSPKVWSYRKNITDAVFGSAEHTEFTERMHRATGGEIAGQERMDLFGLKSATHGILDPKGHTAEDTWQQAISTGQRLESVEVPGRAGRAARQSPAKFSVGEGGQANQKFLHVPEGMSNVGNSALRHAWENKATQRAAAIIGKRAGREEIVPTVGVQAGGWTEARRQAGKNIEEHTPQSQQPRMAKPPVQHELFGSDMQPTSQATVSHRELKKGHTSALAANEARAADLQGNRTKKGMRSRRAATAGASRSREFLSGGQIGLF